MTSAPLLLPILIAVTLAALISTSLVPLIVRAATHLGLLDIPDGDRRIHARAIPRLGGIAIYFGALAGLAAAWLTGADKLFAPAERTLLVGALIATSLMFLVGLRDDLRGVKPGLKLAVQCVAALVLVASGFSIDAVGIIPEIAFPLGPFSIPLAVAWIVGVTNAFNLIDGLDGLAGSVGLVALSVSAGAAVLLGNWWVLPIIAAFGGALLGFLVFNRYPARIFMGDAGSLSLGLLLAVLTVRAASEQTGRVDVLVPVLALAFPLLDTGIAILRRWLRGDPFSRADGRHIHHRIVALGLSQPRTTGLLAGFAVVVGLLAFPLSFARPTIIIAMGTISLALLPLIVLYGLGLLEYHEFFEARASVTSGMRKARSVIRNRIRARELTNDIARARSVPELDAILLKGCELFGFDRIWLRAMGPSSATINDGADRSEWWGGRAIGAWRLEYYIDARTYEGVGPFVLEIHCSDAPGAVVPVSAERVARILAPALMRIIPLIAREAALDRQSASASDALRPERHAPELVPPAR